MKDGWIVYQHYEIESVCWHAGTLQANVNEIGAEHTGGAPGNLSEPLTPEQLEASVNLVTWICQQKNIPQVRRIRGWEGLHEHNDFYSTACPSNRIPWREYERDDMALTMMACGDSPSGYRLYAVGQDKATWIVDPVAAQELIRIFGQPVGVKFQTLTLVPVDDLLAKLES